MTASAQSSARVKWARAGRGHFVAFTAMLVLLGGCAETRIRKQSQADMGAGDYEKALRSLDDGVKQYPESTILRSGQIQARSAAIAQMVATIESLRAAGRLEEAQAEVRRAQTLDPQNRRLDALWIELNTERRQLAALAEAEQWVEKKRPEQALRIAEQALKDNPRHAGLLALQRRLELDQRQEQLRAAQTPLSETRPISLDFRDASLRTVLDLMSRNSGINFILDKDIRQDLRVTVFLRQSKFEDALELLVGTNQLAKKVIDNQTVIVYPNTPEKQREYQEQIVRVFYLASTEAKGAAAFLKAMLKIREPFVDERTNMLALRESPENMQLAERLVALYDSADPEVMLEVEVLEINSTRLSELGVKFPDAISLTVLPPASADGLTLSNIRGLTRDRIGVGVGSLLINLKREVGDFTTLANPKIRARNKEKAKILIGDKIPIITSTTGTGGFVSDSVSYLDVGLKLDVEPTVYNDDDVAIKVSLEVSSLGTAVKTASGTLAYQIGTRNASTLLRLHDGETQLLAGLISREDRTNSSRVPGVGDLPVLGRLFSSQLDNGQRTELVLAITPRILRNVRRPDATETELWVGTEAAPRLRPVGGLRVLAAPAEPATQSAIGPAQAPGDLTPMGMPPAGGRPTDAPAIPQPGLTWSGTNESKVGESVEFKLALTSPLALRGMPVELAFSKDKLQLIDVAEGEYFRRDGAPTSFSKSGDGKEGRIGAGVLRNQGTGATGQGAVLTLRFKALAAGPAELRVVSAQAIGLEGPVPPPTLPPPFAVQIR